MFVRNISSAILAIAVLIPMVWANVRRRDTPAPPLPALYEKIIIPSTDANLKAGWHGYGWPMTAYSRHAIYPVQSWNALGLLADCGVVFACIAIWLTLCLPANANHSRESIDQSGR